MAPVTPVELRLWYFRFATDKFGVIVEGFRATDESMQDMSNWSTTTIKKASGRLLETNSGSQYKLIGEIDFRQAKHAGFPDSLVSLFRKGFPENWEKILKDYYDKYKATNPLNASKWFDHKMALEKRRESVGVNVDPKPRQNRITIAPINETIENEYSTEKESKPVVNENSAHSIADKPIQIAQEELPLRRSPRNPIIAFSGSGSNHSTIMATPNVINMTTSTMTTHKDDGATPRFVPLSEGRFVRRRAATSMPETTPNKAKSRKNSTEVSNNTNVPLGTHTPRHGRTVENPTIQEIQQRTPDSIASRTRSASVTPRNLRSSSTTKDTPKKAQIASVSRTPRRTISTTPKATPNKTKKELVRSQSVSVESKKEGSQRRKVVAEERQSRPQMRTVNSQQEISKFAATVPGTCVKSVPVIGEKQTPRKSTLPVSDVSKAIPLDETFKVPELVHSRIANVSVNKVATILSEWFIKFMPEMINKSGDHPPFILVGTNMNTKCPSDSNQSWHTTLISRVVEGKTGDDFSFFTMRGSEYKTSGKINIKEMALQHAWFTKELVANFSRGFPIDWKAQLWLAFERFKEVAKRSSLPNLVTATVNESKHAPENEKGAEAKQPVNRPRSISALPILDESNTSQRARQLKKSRDMDFPLPVLNVERGGSQWIGVKKRMVKYSSSDSDDNEAVVKTMRMIQYDDAFSHSRGPNAKKMRMTLTDDDGSREVATIRKIHRKKQKLCREIKELDRLMTELAAKMQKKLANQNRMQRIMQEDYDYDLADKYIEKKPSKQRKMHKRSNQHEFTETSDEDDAFLSSSDTNESDSTETEISDEGDEWERAPAKRRNKVAIQEPKNNKRRRNSANQEKKKLTIFTDVNELSSDEVQIPHQKTIKKSNWKDRDLERLKQAVNLYKVRCEDDWKHVVKAVGSKFTAEDCKDMAIKKLQWKPPVEDKKLEEEAMVITARQGTQAYKIQADEQSRKYLLGAGSQEVDCFRDQAPEEDEEDLVVGVGDLDDSILAALKTPKLDDRLKKGGKRGGGPCMPALFTDEETPRAARKSQALNEPNTAERENHQRYLHHITNNRSYLNTAKMNSTQNISMMERSRAVENFGRNMDKIQKTVLNQMPKNRREHAFDEEKEDDEFV